MIIEVGTILWWNNFPYPKFGGKSKPRWFICLGSTRMYAQVSTIYFGTTTTQSQPFQAYGQRQNHDHFHFDVSQYPVFEENCILDFDERPYPILKTKLETNKSEIKIKGKLDENTMRMIYNRYLKSNTISPIELLDIHESYNQAGIVGLNKPKLR